MKNYNTGRIRNLALVGHSGSGKTSLTEAMLFKSGTIGKLGNINSGNTVSDFDKEEIERKASISLSVSSLEWNDTKINLIDAPGYFDFEGQVKSALKASEAALFVLDAQAGIEVGTEKYWKYCEKIGLPRIIFVNKIDKEDVNFNEVVANLHTQFGKKVTPLVLTLGDGAHPGAGKDFKGLIDVMKKEAYTYNGFDREKAMIPEIRMLEVEEVYNQLAEIVALTDDSLMEKFFEGINFTTEEFAKGITNAMIAGSVVPLIVGSATEGYGIDELLNIISYYMPAPNNKKAHIGFRALEGENRPVDEDQPFSAYVFKTYMDPFVGRISLFKVLSGKITKNDSIYNATRKIDEKSAGLFRMEGKKQIEVDQVVAGDIGAFTKLEETETGDTLADKNNVIVYKTLKQPQASLTYAIVPKTKKDEDKIGHALLKLQEEDTSFVFERNNETKQLTISGVGNVQLQIVLDKLKNKYGVETERIPLRIPYRETITGKSDVQGKHKKQSGGAGQYGDVFIKFEPIEDGFEFTEEVFGGAVPKNYFPAVEKGLEESLEKGILAGYPVVGIKATLYDGSYHPVDSNEMAFKLAAAIAFKEGMKKANPVLLEPIMKLETTIPEEYLGDVMGDINKKRGRILGMEPQEDGTQVIIAEAPYAELFEYAIDLRSMTQGRGSFEMEFVRYEQVPKEQANKIIEEANK
ncbi:elongation factor G [Helcococcus ovis]|uniref:Elongation factor G n=1 Tax=Helcococcus ovis TaxID=72026 RepID=A0A4R9C0S4_9FIRM|nr:elongation factor G [Helcococcus ovis]TFF65202.1 elongation factor G [Helcococcus ovis]TFF65759.1 elongation factor G [Helcococcus ovis]TFF68525.1 elongation factor G [Helcococcus ovis]WNZ01416.1 elongation factor G [Helcococcus ovis]